MVRNIAVPLALALTLAGCATGPEGDRQVSGKGVGATVGAATGAVLGAVIADNDLAGGLIGGAVGAVAGGVVGNVFDRQQQEFEEELAAERRRNEIEITRVREDLLKLTLDSEVSFDFDSASIKPAFDPTIDKLADVLVKYDNTQITVVGHTDDIGSQSYNQGLSERRAEAVRSRLVDYGVSPRRLEAIGRGELEPRTNNFSEAGRQLNRRVEILVRPDDEQTLGDATLY
ncbi:MAG: OmpA family protein [Geminicoccaceae bacterium]